MYIIGFVESNDGAGNEIKIRASAPSTAIGLSARRRRARSIDMDTTPHHDGELPREALLHTADRDETVPRLVWEDVSMLGLRRRFPSMDEGRQRAKGQQQGRFRQMDV